MYARRSKPRPYKRWIVLATIITICIWIISLRNRARIISPLSDNVTASPTTQQKPKLNFLSKPKKPADLHALVKTLADSTWQNYSVMVIDLNSDFRMSLNESAIFDGASVNKIPILVTLYHVASQGNIDFGKTITLQARDVQDYGTGSMRYDKPGTVYSIKTLARLMIQKSDNTAAYILANHILSLKQIENYIESLGTTQTDMIKNTTSNRDIALLFEKMFAGAIASPDLNAEMIGFLKDSDFEDRLPAQLPEGVTVYHKIGTVVGAVHDVGVVESGNMKYYIGVFTSDISDEERASEEVAAVSKLVFEFMQ